MLEPENADHRAALPSVNCLLLDKLQDKVSWTTRSLDELDSVNCHSLLCADFELIPLSADDSLPAGRNIQDMLRERLRHIHISVLGDLISNSATIPAYHASQTAKIICNRDLWSFSGSIAVEKQREFAKRTHSLADNLSQSPKSPGLEDVLAIVWKASEKWLWVEDVESASFLQRAVSLYRDNDTFKAEKDERCSPTQSLTEPIETILTRPKLPPESHPPSPPPTSGLSDQDQTLINASNTAGDLGSSASTMQSEIMSPPDPV